MKLRRVPNHSVEAEGLLCATVEPVSRYGLDAYSCPTTAIRCLPKD